MSTIETVYAPVPSHAAQQPAGRRRSRPLTEYWDVRTAGWRTAAPVPAPRRGD